jgi:hypothetical protein
MDESCVDIGKACPHRSISVAHRRCSSDTVRDRPL